MITLGGGAALILALFAVARSMLVDTRLSRRIERYAGQLEDRIRKLERTQARQRSRIFQLEALLRLAGIPIPPWPASEDDEPQTPGAPRAEASV